MAIYFAVALVACFVAGAALSNGRVAAMVVLVLVTAGFVVLAILDAQSMMRGWRQHPAPRLRSHAYLVLHLDLRQSPPRAVYAHIYSCSARDLTLYGGEAHADLYMVSAETFEQALHEMEAIVPLYFPWVMPLMRR